MVAATVQVASTADAFPAGKYSSWAKRPVLHIVTQRLRAHHAQQLQEASGTLDSTQLTGQNFTAPRRIFSDGPNEVVLHLSRNAQNGFEI